MYFDFYLHYVLAGQRVGVCPRSAHLRVDGFNMCRLCGVQRKNPLSKASPFADIGGVGSSDEHIADRSRLDPMAELSEPMTPVDMLLGTLALSPSGVVAGDDSIELSVNEYTLLWIISILSWHDRVYKTLLTCS